MRIFVVIVLIVASAAALAASRYHFILVDDGLKVLKKTQPTLQYTFVDGRGIVNQMKILTNPTLVEAGVRNVLSGEGVTIRPKEEFEKGWNDMKD